MCAISGPVSHHCNKKYSLAARAAEPFDEAQYAELATRWHISAQMARNRCVSSSVPLGDSATNPVGGQCVRMLLCSTVMRMQPSVRCQPLHNRGLPTVPRHQKKTVLSFLEQKHFHRNACMPEGFVITKAVADVHALVIGGVKDQGGRCSFADLQFAGE